MAGPVDEECRVVYLLAQIRKVLHDDDSADRPFALWMYCHWALHVDLERRKTTIEFLQAVDNYVCNNVEQLDSHGSSLFTDENGWLDDYIYLDAFREQLGDFLESNGLPTQLTDEDTAWLSFLAAYAGVIEDGTLSAMGEHGLVTVEKITFRKESPRFSENPLSFVIRWDIQLKDERMLTIRTEARQGL